ncbi:MAG: hypothetical protein K5985_07605 [Lachnospiraceae bacterium]|nr:hypothetical protein [Lachnospiraceae bacterium]
MDGMTPEQQALFNSIMNNAAPKPFVPVAPAPAPAPASAAPAASVAPAAPVAPAPDANSSRILSQAEIDALIASMS